MLVKVVNVKYLSNSETGQRRLCDVKLRGILTLKHFNRKHNLKLLDSKPYFYPIFFIRY